MKNISAGVLLLQKHLPKYLLGYTVFLILDLLLRIFKKPAASCFIFLGLHEPKKHQVYYNWVIRLNDKF